MGRGARHRGGQTQRDPGQGHARRGGLPAPRRELRRRRHADALHGDLSRLPLGVGRAGPGLRLRPGREVLPLGAPLRRVLAPRVHGRGGLAQLRLHHQFRQQQRGLGGRLRRLEAGRRPLARVKTRSGRAAPVGDRRLVGRMGADQAQDRPGLHVRADPPHRAGAQLARSLRREVPHRNHQLALPRRPARLLPARHRERQALDLGPRRREGQAVRRRDRRRGHGRPLHGRRLRGRPRRRALGARLGRSATVVRTDARAYPPVHARVGRGRVRRARGNHPPRRRRVRRAREDRHHHHDRRGDPAAPPRGRDARQGRQQRLGRLPGHVGPHDARVPRWRAGSSGRNDGHQGPAQPSRGQPPEERQARRGRVHDLPVQLHQEGRVAVEAPHPQRLQDAGAAGGELAMVGGAGSRAPAVAVPAQGAQALAAPDAAGNVDLLPHQPGDLVMERARGCQAHRRIPVHACVRLHAGRVQLDGRRDPAGSHRP